MGEELGLGKLFIQNSDGSYTEFSGIQDCSGFVTNCLDNQYNPEYFQIPSELSATIIMSHKQKREFSRMLRRSIGHHRRTIRRFIRLKEKVRRNMIKEATGNGRQIQIF